MFPYATPQIPYVIVGPFFDIMLDESKSLMYLVNGKWIYVMNTDQNLLVDVINKPHAAGYFNTFALNKRRIFGLGEVVGYPFYMINLDTKEVKYLQPDGGHIFQSGSIPISSPDGSKVFITVFNDQFKAAGMDVFNAETGNFEVFIPNLTTLGGFVYNCDSTLAYLNQGEFTVTNSQIFELSTLSKTGVIPAGGYSGISSKDNRFLYFAKNALHKRRHVDLGSSFNLDLTVMDLNANYSFSIDVTTKKTYSCLYRSIAVSGDNRHVVITNPSLNSVSIVSDIQESVPAAVSLESPDDSINIVFNQITFSWSPLPDISNYHLQISDTETFSEIDYQDSLITQSSVTLNSIQKNRQYFWRVRARNIIGWGNWSEAGMFTTNDNNLPVELLSFDAHQINQSLELKWSTITETNNYGFEIHKSFQNIDNDWQIIGFIKGAGTSVEKHEYLFKDNNIKSGRYYYRLKQIDLDGTYKYLDTISVETDFLIEEYSLSQNFPNPFNPSTTIRYSVPKTSFVSIKIYDLLGREVTTLVNENLPAGTYSIEFNADKLLSSVYFYKMEAESFSEIKKLILLR